MSHVEEKDEQAEGDLTSLGRTRTMTEFNPAKSNRYEPVWHLSYFPWCRGFNSLGFSLWRKSGCRGCLSQHPWLLNWGPMTLTVSTTWTHTNWQFQCLFFDRFTFQGALQVSGSCPGLSRTSPCRHDFNDVLPEYNHHLMSLCKNHPANGVNVFPLRNIIWESFLLLDKVHFNSTGIQRYMRKIRVLSKFNGTSTRKGSYSAKTGVNCTMSLSRSTRKEHYGQMSAKAKAKSQVTSCKKVQQWTR